MSIEPNKSRRLESAGEVKIGTASGYRDQSCGRGEPVAAVEQSTGFRAAVIVALAVYLAALGGSALLHIRARILDPVPFCLTLAIFLCLYSRQSFRRSMQAARIVEAASIVVTLGLSLACLSYVSAIAALPLRDVEIISIDRYLGFDWLQLMRELDRRPGVLSVLDAAYATFTPQLIVTVLALVLAKRSRELDRFFITFACASIIAEVASFLVPTLGPMAMLADGVKFANLPTVGRTTAEIVLALRNGALNGINFNALDGIISFPSLHTAVAVIVPYTLRWSKVLFWPSLTIDLLMLISTIPSGNHYLTDVLAGLAVAVLAIRCGRHVHETIDAFMDRLA